MSQKNQYPIILKLTEGYSSLYVLYSIVIPLFLFAMLPKVTLFAVLCLIICVLSSTRSICRSLKPAIIIDEEGIRYFQFFAKQQLKLVPWQKISTVRSYRLNNNIIRVAEYGVSVCEPAKTIMLFGKAFPIMQKSHILPVQKYMISKGHKVSSHEVLTLIRQAFAEELPEQFQQERQVQKKADDMSIWQFLFEVVLVSALILILTSIGVIIAIAGIVVIVAIVYFLFWVFKF